MLSLKNVSSLYLLTDVFGENYLVYKVLVKWKRECAKALFELPFSSKISYYYLIKKFVLCKFELNMFK